jgi:hypothetical protein
MAIVALFMLISLSTPMVLIVWTCSANNSVIVLSVNTELFHSSVRIGAAGGRAGGEAALGT